MNLESFTGSGSTPSRRRFWDKVTAYVIASQKVAGKNVSVSEHQGAGTLINVTRGRSAVCPDCPSEESVFVALEGVNFCEGCIQVDDSSSVIIGGGQDINGTYEVPFFSSGGSPPYCCYELDTGILIDFDYYTGSACDVLFGPFQGSFQIWVARWGSPDVNGSCQWVIYAYLQSLVPDQMRVFQGNPQVSFSTPFSNASICGPGINPDNIFQTSCSVREWEVAVAEGGTATLSL